MAVKELAVLSVCDLWMKIDMQSLIVAIFFWRNTVAEIWHWKD